MRMRHTVIQIAYANIITKVLHNRYRIFFTLVTLFFNIFSNNEKRRKSLHFDDVTHVFFIFVFI